VSTSNVEYRLSHRAGGTQWKLVAYDGAATWLAIEADKATNTILINGIDITTILPAGGTNGNFLQKGAPNVWNQVDLAATTNVKFTGGAADMPVKRNSNGTLRTESVDLTTTQIVLTGIADTQVLAKSGGVVGSYSQAGLASYVLTAPGVIGIISGLAGFDLTTLNSTFTAISNALDVINARIDALAIADISGLSAALANKSDIGHGHSGTTGSAGTPAHSHSVSL
jgi:hypothetical protein